MAIRPIPPSLAIVAIALLPRKYKTFRNHRNVRYWEKGEEKRKRKEQNRKTAQKRLGSRAGYHYIGAPWGSVGFRWVPRLPIWPTPSLLPAIVAITLPTRKIPDVAKPPKRLVWGEGRRKGENGKSKIGKRPKKRLGMRAGYPYMGALWGSVGYRWVPRLPIWPIPRFSSPSLL